MAVASFEDFCTSICGLIGVAPPSLEADAIAGVGFTVTYHGASISFIDVQTGNESGLLMTVEFGTPPSDKEPDVLRHLMDANFLMSGVGAPAFERDPATGEISLRYSFPLPQVDVQTIYQCIAEAAEAVSNWRDSHFLDMEPPEGAAAHPEVSVSDLA